jgi:hypothetical protein
MSGETPDWRGLKARLLVASPDWEDEGGIAAAHVGQIGTLSSIYTDGRPCHDESYLITFEDGTLTAAMAEELEVIKETVTT